LVDDFVLRKPAIAMLLTLVVIATLGHVGGTLVYGK
jgi:hypothetical protein